MTTPNALPDLIHVESDGPGYSRRGRGRGFEYFDEEGEKITDKEELQRIKALVIPPAWTKVWICPEPRGHLQAAGRDAKGRKQYRYHDDWTAYRNATKFLRLADFARALPGIRQRLQADLGKKGWPREKVLALAVSVLDESYLRIGNDSYARDNQTYGLTTLRRKHVQENGSSLTFTYQGKSGRQRSVDIEDPQLVRLIKGCSQLPGYEILKYEDERGDRHDVVSQDVNAYIQDITGADYSAKDFRTWGGTVLALETFEAARQAIEANPRRKLETALIEGVAERLGNTVAICRTYYIHPAVLTKLLDSDLSLPDLYRSARGALPELDGFLEVEELAALYLIER